MLQPMTTVRLGVFFLDFYTDGFAYQKPLHYRDPQALALCYLAWGLRNLPRRTLHLRLTNPLRLRQQAGTMNLVGIRMFCLDCDTEI